MADFTFLRPFWLLGLVVLFIIPIIRSQIAGRTSPWLNIADSFLLKNLLVDKANNKKSNLLKPILTFCWIITIIGLSGPAWDKTEVSTVSAKSNFLIISEISPNTMANDLKPNRLDRLKYKLYDLFEKIKDEKVGLIVYDNFPYVLSPFTDDVSIIKNFTEVFDINMMPSPGANLDRALSKALEVTQDYKNTNIILFISGDNYNKSIIKDIAKELKKQNHTLSIIALAQDNNVPIPNSKQGFLKNSSGNTVLSNIDSNFLNDIAKSTGGVFTKITANDADIDSIIALSKTMEKSESSKKVMWWKDMGIYIPFILLPFALILFKRGFLISFLILFSLPSYAFTWEDLWYNNNQQGQMLLPTNPEKAAEKFTDKSYKGTAEYKSKQYDKALQNFNAENDYYNAGNALAHLGKIEEAIKSYEKALEINPNNEDAKYNLEYLKQQQQQSQGGGKNQDEQNQQNKDNQNGQQGQQKEQNPQSQNDQNQQNQNSQQNEQTPQPQDQGQQQSQGEQPQQSQGQNNEPQWKLEPNESSTENKENTQNGIASGKTWQDPSKNNSYDLLKAKLRLIYKKEYNQ